MRKKSLIGQKTNPFTCRCTVNDYKKYRTEIYYKKQIYIPLITRYSPWQYINVIPVSYTHLTLPTILLV